MTAGVLAYGTYVPAFRIAHEEVATQLRIDPRNGLRAVAAADQDTTCLAVEACRVALASRPDVAEDLSALVFTTPRPAYQDKSNAIAIHSALRLPANVKALDAIGSAQTPASLVSLLCHADTPSLVVTSDIRFGKAGSRDELEGGDAAVALVVGDCAGVAPIAEILASSSRTREVLVRWRAEGEAASREWEDRFVEFAFAEVALEAVNEALRAADVDPAGIARLILGGTAWYAGRGLAGELGLGGAAPDDLKSLVGDTGSAHTWLQLADALDTAEPGDTLLVVTIAESVDVMVIRAAAGIRDGRPAVGVRRGVVGSQSLITYAQFLTWRGIVEREPPRRPDATSPLAPASLRSDAWKLGFMGGKCHGCGVIHLPPQRICGSCGRAGQMSLVPMADAQGTVATFTSDFLAPTLNPPAIIAAVDFPGRARLLCELADVHADSVNVGTRVSMTFRLMNVGTGGIRNYFWKATPIMDGV